MKNIEVSAAQPVYWISNAGQFGLLLALSGCGILAGAFVVAGIFLTDSNGSLSSVVADVSSVQPSLLRLAQVSGTFLQFALPAWVFAVILKQNPWSFYYLNKRSSIKLWLLIIAIALSGVAFNDLLASLNEQVPVSQEIYASFMQKEKHYIEQIMHMIDLTSPVGLLLSVTLIAVFPAVFEELLFRGALQPILVRWTKSVFWGIFITSLFFALMHFSFLGLLPRLFLGMALGYVFYFSKNLWLSIVFHFVNNAVAIFSFYSLYRSGELNFETATQHMPLMYQVAGSTLFVALVYLFYKECRKMQPGLRFF